MMGNLDMNNNKIKSLSDPTDNKDAANKEYVDEKIKNFDTPNLLDLKGTRSMDETLKMNSNKIINLAEVTEDGDATNLKNVKEQIRNLELLITGYCNSYTNNFDFVMENDYFETIDPDISKEGFMSSFLKLLYEY